ncbi:hypothetical protein ACIBG8_17720 [Nonomuraea sp. NPDC050556]|uniref:hypothetical protein n=1 Tax=Nonomuraea sp. NPDC050556 TaxID=3364369 RepID=UPI0037896D0A
MTRRLRRRALSVCATICLLVLPVVPTAYADPRPVSIEAWQRSTSARLEADGSLSDVLALSAGDVWAVGQQQIWDAWKNRGTIRHWNGSAWAEIPVRDSAAAGSLRAVAAAGPNDVWAIGDASDGLPYLAHGDTGGFDRVEVPLKTRAGGGYDGLQVGDWLGGVDARPGKVVAVGSRDSRGLIVTGQGNAWTIQVLERKSTLHAVANGFAVGDAAGRPLVMHLSGGSWKAASLPDIPGGYLRDVQVDGPKRAIAVGGVYRGDGRVAPLVLSWNGKRWHRETLPASNALLYGVAGDGKGRYWISGYDPDEPERAYLVRMGKGSTQVIRGGTVSGRRAVRLQAVAYVPGSGAVWAVGHAVDAADKYTDVVETFGPKGPTAADS